MIYYRPYADIDLHHGKLVKRANRFVAICEVGQKSYPCHLPNPGRLWELLRPQSEIILTKNEKGKTNFTVVAVKSPKGPILLHTHRTNDLAQSLLDQNAIPSLKGYRVSRREVTHGDSRFDFLLEAPDGAPFFLEVKSCTLFGSQGAMFPDAPSSRATKHVSELEDMSKSDIRTGVLFVAHSHIPSWFCPEYHTDPDFARTIAKAREKVKVMSLTVKWNSDLSITEQPREIPIRWEILDSELRDRGGCLALFYLDKPEEIRLSGEKTALISEGYWALSTGASVSLKKAISRLAKDKLGPSTRIIPFRAADSLGQELMREISPLAAARLDLPPITPHEEGATLFKFDMNPMENDSFIDVIIRTRIDRLNIP